jgi:hypothetical protein
VWSSRRTTDACATTRPSASAITCTPRVAPILVGEPLDVVAPGLVEELAEGDHLVRTQRVTADEPDQWIGPWVPVALSVALIGRGRSLRRHRTSDDVAGRVASLARTVARKSGPMQGLDGSVRGYTAPSDPA